MKKLLSLLAAALLLPAVASADVLNNVTLTGEIQTIGSGVKHNHFGTYSRGTWVRALTGVSADLVEDVTANLMFAYTNIWGQDGIYGQDVDQYLREIRVIEGNVVLHNLFCGLEAKIGRQFYGDEDSAVMYIGPNHYNADYGFNVYSLDAAKVTYSDDVKTLTLLAGRIRGDYSPDIISLYGADLKLNVTDALTAQVYGYDMDEPGSPAGRYTGFYGAKLALDAAVRLSAEYARNFGGDRLIKEHKNTGHMVKVDAATDVKAVTVRGTFYYANGNFEALGNYTPGLLVGHRKGGRIYEYTDGRGVALFNVGFDYKPAEKWTLSLDGYSFQNHRMKHAATLEADLTAKYAHNNYVELFAGVGYAKYTGSDPDATEFHTDNVGPDNVKAQLGMLIKF